MGLNRLDIFLLLSALVFCAPRTGAQVKSPQLSVVHDKIESPASINCAESRLAGMTDSQKLALADSLWEAYGFRGAAKICDALISESEDSLTREYASELKHLCVNGMRYSSSVSIPIVIDRKKFSLTDFFLYYPLPDKSWRRVEDCHGLRDSISVAASRSRVPECVFYPEHSGSVLFSTAVDSCGRKIFRSAAALSPYDASSTPGSTVQNVDSLFWSRPEMVFSEDSLSLSAMMPDELFPMLSADGRSMTFSAKREDGVGGYDIYESVWSDADSCWSEPVNLGFPYSSTGNDYLFVNTDDGRYTFFASDRGCSKDSVYVYVLEYEFVPTQEEVMEADRLQRIMELDPEAGHHEDDAGGALNGGIPENSQTQEYMKKMDEVRRLRSRLDSTVTRLEQMREVYAMSDEVEQRMALTDNIIAIEQEVPRIQDELDAAVLQVQRIEMDFLFRGVVIDYDSLSGNSRRTRRNYEFARRSFGPPVIFRMALPPSIPVPKPL